MSDFINTLDVIGDDALTDSVISRTITECRDDSIVSIGNSAFDGCSALTIADFPAATSIGESAFRYCSALTIADFPAATSIGESAFRYCSALQTVNFPATISMGKYVFQDCPELTSVTFPLVTSISDKVFSGCSSLTTADFPAATSIDDNAFYNCKALTTADFPVVTSISNVVFPNCLALTSVILRNTAQVATLVGAGSFNNTPIKYGTGYIYVPSDLVDSYKSATNWSTYAAQFRALEDYTVDGTVTGELDAANRRMVRFFHEDGTLLGYKVVAVGSDATFDEPVKEGEWAFTGWSPEPTNVTEDMDCYAQFRSTDIYNWDSVFAAIDNRTYKNVYAIGDTVPLDLGSEGLINMQIVAFDTDDLADGTGKAPITWIAKELLATSCRMNPAIEGSRPYVEGTGCIGGWEKSEIRTYLKETVKSMIPELVRTAIKDVTKTQTSFDTNAYSSQMQTTADDVWLPSSTEIGANGLYYEMFLDTASLRIKNKVGNTSGHTWLSRDASSRSMPRHVREDGLFSSAAADVYHGVALSFCT